jgi:putative transposase
MIKTLQVKVHNPSNYKKMLLDRTIKNYNRAYNEMLVDAQQNIENIKQFYISKSGKYSAQQIAKFFSGKDFHKKFGLEPLYDSLKSDVAASVASYLELLKTDDNTSFPYIKSSNKEIKYKINLINSSIVNNIELTNEEIHKAEQEIKELEGTLNKNNKLLPISYGRYDIDRDCCLLYSPKRNKYYAKLYIMGRDESKKMFFNYKSQTATNTNLNLDELFYIPSFEKYEVDNTKPQAYILVPLEFGRWHESYLKLARKGVAKLSAMKLIKRNGDFYLDIPIDVHVENKQYTPENKCGIDMGVENIATITITDNKNEVIYSKRFNKSEVSINEMTYQQAIDKYIDELSDAQSKGKSELPNHKKFIDGYLHTIANEIVKTVIQYKAQVNVEDLTKMNKSKWYVCKNKKFDKFTNKGKNTVVKNINRWAYGQLQNIIAQKMSMNNAPKINKINPRFTSETCSKCGHNEVVSSKGQNKNRESQDVFICKKCGLVYNADENAAINIANYYDKVITLKPKEKDGIFYIKHPQFKFEGIGTTPEQSLNGFIEKLKEYKIKYDTIPKEDKQKGSKLAKQYAILKKLEEDNYIDYFAI